MTGVRHFLIMFRGGHHSPAEAVGIMRFEGVTTFEQRQEALAEWAKVYRPNQVLQENEALWLAGPLRVFGVDMGMYFDAEGTFRNADGTRNIFCDVDQ